MKPRHFPVITICPIPSFKKSELTKHGYANSYQFARGKYMHNTEMMGWLGHGKVDRKVPKFILLLSANHSCSSHPVNK